jgi:hypothetical protein
MVYKYKLSLCLCIKNESKYIIEFIEHYIKQGVEHFYIINNNSDDNLEEIMEKSSYNSLVTLIKDDRSIDINNAYSLTNGLMAVYNNNLYEIVKNETEWGIVVDIDEFMYGKNGFNIKTFLENVDDSVGCIYVIWNIMTSSTIKNEDNNSFSIHSNNFKRLNYDLISGLSYNIINANDFGKSIFRTSMLNGLIGLHKSHFTTGKVINNYGENKNSWYDNGNSVEYSENNFKNINISLNHYVIRNYDDYIKKKAHFDCNVEQRNALLKGVFELLELDDMYFVTDNEINEINEINEDNNVDKSSMV